MVDDHHGVFRRRRFESGARGFDSSQPPLCRDELSKARRPRRTAPRGGREDGSCPPREPGDHEPFGRKQNGADDAELAGKPRRQHGAERRDDRWRHATNVGADGDGDAGEKERSEWIVAADQGIQRDAGGDQQQSDHMIGETLVVSAHDGR